MGTLSRRDLLLGSAALGSLALLAGCGIAVPGLSTPAGPRTIGMVYGLRPSGPYPEVDVLLDRLRQLDWNGAEEPRVEIRSGDGTPAKLAEVAAELVARPVDVLVTSSLPPLQALKAATTTIPIVFSGISNPVELGLVKGLREPGVNLTGLTNLNIQLVPKRLELLKEIAPRITRVAIVFDPTNQGNVLKWEATRAAAAQLGLQLAPVEIRSADELPRVLAEIKTSGADGLLLFADPLTFSLLKPVAEFARSARLPSAYDFAEFPGAGGLYSYGVDPVAAFGQVGDYVDKIFRGANPATLPVEHATSLKLVVNLATADAIGLGVPASILAQATDTIQ